MSLPDTVNRNSLRDLSAAQCQVLTRAQLRLLGVNDARITHRVEVRKWQSPTRRVIVLHNGPLTAMQRMWVAVLATGGALCGCALQRPSRERAGKLSEVS